MPVQTDHVISWCVVTSDTYGDVIHVIVDAHTSIETVVDVSTTCFGLSGMPKSYLFI